MEVEKRRRKWGGGQSGGVVCPDGYSYSARDADECDSVSEAPSCIVMKSQAFADITLPSPGFGQASLYCSRPNSSDTN